MIKLWNKSETLKQKCKRLENDCEVFRRYYEDLSRVNDQWGESYNRLLTDYQNLKMHYKELSKECKESQEENISLLIKQKSLERTKNKMLDEVQQLHDRVMELIAEEEMNEDD